MKPPWQPIPDNVRGNQTFPVFFLFSFCWRWRNWSFVPCRHLVARLLFCAGKKDWQERLFGTQRPYQLAVLTKTRILPPKSIFVECLDLLNTAPNHPSLLIPFSAFNSVRTRPPCLPRRILTIQNLVQDTVGQCHSKRNARTKPRHLWFGMEMFGFQSNKNITKQNQNWTRLKNKFAKLNNACQFVFPPDGQEIQFTG